MNIGDQVTGVVLAGGKSSRFGSNKALADYKGQPMLKHICDILSPLCQNIFVSGEYPEYEELGIKTYPDQISDIGPLGGIYSSIQHTTASRLLILTCDMPLVSTRLLRELLDQQQSDIVLFEKDQQPLLFPMLLSNNQKVKDAIDENIRTNRYAIRKLLDKIDKHYVSIKETDSHLFSNLNYTSEYESLTRTN